MSVYLMSQNDETICISKNILSLDLEFVATRCVENKRRKYFQEIVEIGIQILDENGYKEYTSIIKPRYFIEEDNKNKHTMHATRFSSTNLSKGVDLKEAFEEINKIYDNENTIWFSWGLSDYYILKNVCSKYGINMPFRRKKYLDLSFEFKRFYNISYKISLDKALKFLKINAENRHKALCDAKDAMRILVIMIEQGYNIEEKFF